MSFESCPRCKSNNWSKFQTGNTKNETYNFTAFCNVCHGFSYSFECSPDGYNQLLESYSIITKKYIVKIDKIIGKTIVTHAVTQSKVFTLDVCLKIEPNMINKDIDSKINKLVLFS